MQLTLRRLAAELVENHDDFAQSALVGLQPRGIYLADRLAEILRRDYPLQALRLGYLDTTFHRDDFRRRPEPLAPNAQQIDFLIEELRVVLIDDVFYTGRTVRAALDALLDFGRPSQVELLTLVDRKFSRQLPISPDYVGISVDTRLSQRVRVQWQATEGEDLVRMQTAPS
jgi:pyrimidine operon attenuation protein/uracil phosphoribosyltransferase